VKPRTKAIHTVQVLDHRFSINEAAKTIWATIFEAFPDENLIFLAINSDFPVLRDQSAQFVQEHTDEFVRYVRFSSSGSRAQLRG